MLFLLKNGRVFFGKSRKKDDNLEQFHIDLATSVQRFTEETIFYMLTKLHDKNGIR